MTAIILWAEIRLLKFCKLQISKFTYTCNNYNGIDFDQLGNPHKKLIYYDFSNVLRFHLLPFFVVLFRPSTPWLSLPWILGEDSSTSIILLFLETADVFQFFLNVFLFSKSSSDMFISIRSTCMSPINWFLFLLLTYLKICLVNLISFNMNVDFIGPSRNKLSLLGKTVW